LVSFHLWGPSSVLETLKWEKVTPKGLKFKARFGACSGEIAGKLYVFGGSIKAKGFTNNLKSYDLGLLKRRILV